MSRGDGFTIADIDTRYFYDRKMKALGRTYPDLFAPAAVAHMGILLASWACGERVPAIDGWPEFLPWSQPVLDALKDVGLLDRSGRLPAKTWIEWFGPAFERREKRRSAGAVGGQHKASNARAGLEQPPSDALPVPTVPTVPSVPTDSPKPPRAGASRKNGTNLRARGRAPKQIQAANERALIDRYAAMGGMKSMPPGLKGEDN